MFHIASLVKFFFLFFSPKKQQKTFLFCFEGLISLIIVALDFIPLLFASNGTASNVLKIAAVAMIIVKFGPRELVFSLSLPLFHCSTNLLLTATVDFKAIPLVKEMWREIVSGEPTDEDSTESTGSCSSTFFVPAPAWSPSASLTGQAAAVYPNTPAHESKGSVSPTSSSRTIAGSSLALVPEQLPFSKPIKGKRGRY